MDWIENVENIIKSKKWIRNDIGMGRVQYNKLIRIGEELKMFILSNTMERPLYARVEKIMLDNGELILFYDGEYSEFISKDEYEEYKEFMTKIEWDTMFEHDGGLKLENMNLVSKGNGFYAEIHQTVEKYINEKYDEATSKAIEEHFNL